MIPFMERWCSRSLLSQGQPSCSFKILNCPDSANGRCYDGFPYRSSGHDGEDRARLCVETAQLISLGTFDERECTLPSSRPRTSCKELEIGRSTSILVLGYQILTRPMTAILRDLDCYCSQYIVARIRRPACIRPSCEHSA
jgi:hypothetical protein